ncbi:MAG: flagellar export protein FliJ [Oscillospiraceae bacterium]
MEAFKFSLSRVRNYKSQVLDKEKKTLAALQRQRSEIQDRINVLEAYRARKAAEIVEKQKKGATMVELMQSNFLIENARTQITAAREELKKMEAAVEAQRKVVLSIYQEKTGMDKLEEKQVEEYRVLEAKAAENEIMQVISNKLASSGGDESTVGIA